MRSFLPSKLSIGLALEAHRIADRLTNKEICRCIEILSGVKLTSQEKRQKKVALIQVLNAATEVRRRKIQKRI